MSAATVKAFDSAYPGSMCERKDGYYVERKDAASLAAALLEQIRLRDSEIEDAQAAAIRLENELRGLVGAIEAAGMSDMFRDAMASAHDALGSL